MAPKICVGLAGPVGVGKSALLKALVDNEKSDARRRSTQDLEFAHSKIYKCSSASTRASCYSSSGLLLDMEHNDCDTPGHAMERFSLAGRADFIDCPGDLFSVPTILKGIMMADGVLILSQPTDGFGVSPTLEALAAAHLMGRSIAVVQIIKSAADRNKLKEHQKEIRRCMIDLQIHPDVEVPLVEVSSASATSSVLKGIGDVCRRVIDMVPQRPRGELAASSSSSSDAPAAALMLIASSCVVDPVGEEVDAVAAAAAVGDASVTFVTIIGRVVQGVVSAGDEVEVRPGIVMMGDDRKNVCHPITLKVVSVMAAQKEEEEEQEEEEEERGDGLVALRAIATIINVAAEKRNQHQLVISSVLGGDGGMGGHVLGHPGCLPSVYDALKIDVLLLPRMGDPYTEEVHDPLPPVEPGQKLLLIIGTMSTFGMVKEVSGRKGRTILVTGLSPPACASYGERILLCRNLTLSWHLIGSGTVVGGGRPLNVADTPAALF